MYDLDQEMNRQEPESSIPLWFKASFVMVLGLMFLFAWRFDVNARQATQLARQISRLQISGEKLRVKNQALTEEKRSLNLRLRAALQALEIQSNPELFDEHGRLREPDASEDRLQREEEISITSEIQEAEANAPITYQH